MIRLLSKKRPGPIGVDIGTRSVKLVQFSSDHGRLVDAARWEYRSELEGETANRSDRQCVEAIRQARNGRKFRGNEAVLCLSERHMFIQNIRIAKVRSEDMAGLVRHEASGRIPFPIDEAEIRYFDGADVRHGDQVLREVIVMGCHRPVLDSYLKTVESAGLRPVSVDVEPLALMRGCLKQFRRDEDRQQRLMFVHVGYSATAVVIAQGEDVVFVKYIDLGGKQMDEAVARHLNMKVTEATALRKHNGDRRAEQQDPVVARSVAEAIRPIVERLLNELFTCIRYHSVTFRGQALSRLLLGGGEANSQLIEPFSERLNMTCELSDPLRGYLTAIEVGRRGQWDVAAGLALRQ